MSKGLGLGHFEHHLSPSRFAMAAAGGDMDFKSLKLTTSTYYFMSTR
jgi:hypothetical protein